ncbi:COG2958 family protein [Acinetobacter pittii]|uniref:COG2958 family protein n=1 Tax=Acinetobacter pittii TaxID=48296 RepID=UPI003B9F78B8
MSRLSLPQRMIEILKSQPNKKFTARDLTLELIQKFSDIYAEKRNNPRFNNDQDFIQQVIAELGNDRFAMLKYCEYIHWQDQPRPRLFWYDAAKINENLSTTLIINKTETFTELTNIPITSNIYSEHDLYPILIEFLKSELNLYCLRIDEKRSKNSRGQNGNQWLHPDIVAMQPLDKQWNELVKTCVKHGSAQNVRLWSFEVKKELNSSNIRSSFFQAVSNSSWANEGYLVATAISTSDVEDEIRMLSALHGIGVILLTPENPTESEILLPARRRTEVDWQSINRIVNENADFKNFIELVSIYYQTGRIRKQDWNY